MSVIHSINPPGASHIKKQLICNLNTINNACLSLVTEKNITEIQENDLYIKIKNNILNEENIKKIIDKYIYYSDFRKNEFSLYQKLAKSKLLGEYCKNLINLYPRRNIKDIILLIEKYNDYSLFLKENKQCYSYIKSKNLEYLLSGLNRKYIKRTIENMSALIKNYTNYSLFIKENKLCYTYIKRNKLDYLLINLERKK